MSCKSPALMFESRVSLRGWGSPWAATEAWTPVWTVRACVQVLEGASLLQTWFYLKFIYHISFLLVNICLEYLFFSSNFSFSHFFWCRPFLMSLLNCLLLLLQYCFCFMLWFFGHEAGGDLSSSTRDQTCNLCIGRRSLNHWTTREVPISAFLSLYTYLGKST